MVAKIYSYAIRSNEDITSELGSSLIHGLSTKQAQERLKTEGTNTLSGEQLHWWHILRRQFKSPFIYLLFLAAVLAFFLGETLDAGMILLFIFVNALLGFYQEFKSEQALKFLRQYTKSTAKVLRDGQEVVLNSSELVRGDIVFLENGDMVPADMRLIEDGDIIIDEAMLSGESVTVHKNGSTLSQEPQDIYGATNLVFTGTAVVAGLNKGVVLAVGEQTAFGQIKKLTTETVKESSFAKGISKFSSFILKLTVVTLVFVFLANVVIKGEKADFAQLLIFSIALAVSVIPEALPVVTTLSLSRGAIRLAKQKVIIKRLSAVEDLGSIEILCTDKTGTITENKLKVQELLALNRQEDLLLYANLTGCFMKESLEPFDVALKKAWSHQELLAQFEKLEECPFDPKRRRNSVLIKDNNNERSLIVRGAPEEIIKLCSNLDQEKRQTLQEWILKTGQQGCRTLAVAIRKIKKDELVSDLAFLETDLNFEGCISFVDPIKPSTLTAIQKAEKLGVGVKIITGDSQEVALNVAKKIGLTEKNQQVVLASEFISQTPERQKEILPNISVFARTDPEQKHYLVQLLQRNYEVGFLGEGINDSPALKAAGVSIVVQGASDIAREAADIILLQKDLAVIIDGIEEGRKIFANTIKYLKATLASNFGNFYAVAIGSLFIDFLPMLPVQLLLVNLLSDFPMISVATDSVDQAETRSPKKYNAKDIIIIATILGVVSTVFDFMFFGFFHKISPEVLQTNWFIGSILTELVFLFSIRTRLPFYQAVFPSKIILWLSGSAFFITVALPFTNIGQKVFHFHQPSASHMILILGLVVAYFACSEIVKNIYYRSFDTRK